MAATWIIIKEWSEKQLSSQFSSIHALACYLVVNCSVGSGSAAAALVTSITENQFKGKTFILKNFVFTLERNCVFIKIK